MSPNVLRLWYVVERQKAVGIEENKCLSLNIAGKGRRYIGLREEKEESIERLRKIEDIQEDINPNGYCLNQRFLLCRR